MKQMQGKILTYKQVETLMKEGGRKLNKENLIKKASINTNIYTRINQTRDILNKRYNSNK